MHIASKDTDADRKFSCKSLKLCNEIVAFLFMCPSSIVVIEIIQQVNVAVKMVEKASACKQLIAVLIILDNASAYQNQSVCLKT